MTLNNVAEKSLIWVVSDVWTKTVDNSVKVAIRAYDELRLSHSRLEAFKDCLKRQVEKLAAKIPELSIIGVLFVGWV